MTSYWLIVGYTYKDKRSAPITSSGTYAATGHSTPRTGALSKASWITSRMSAVLTGRTSIRSATRTSRRRSSRHRRTGNASPVNAGTAARRGSAGNRSAGNARTSSPTRSTCKTRHVAISRRGRTTER